MKNQKENDARRTVRENALTAISNETQAEIPHVLIHEEADTMMEEMGRSLESNRLTLEQYLEMLGKTEEQYHEELEPEAAERVKRELILDAIADARRSTSPTARSITGSNWLRSSARVSGAASAISPRGRRRTSSRVCAATKPLRVWSRSPRRITPARRRGLIPPTKRKLRQNGSDRRRG